MKLGLLVIFTLIGSAVAASLLLQDPGYVVINFRGYLVEMSVPALLAIFVLLLFLIHGPHWFSFSPVSLFFFVFCLCCRRWCH